MSKIEDLVPVLHEKTLNHKLNWQVGLENNIWIKIGDNLIEIGDIDRVGGFKDYVIKIRNSEGLIVDQQSYSYDAEAKLIEDILRIGQRKALKVDETLEKILDKLEKL